jgi:hypothetical protein
MLHISFIVVIVIIWTWKLDKFFGSGYGKGFGFKNRQGNY